MSLFSWFFLTCVFWFACQVPTINELEQRMHSLLRARALRLLQRRQQDVRDQCQDYMTSLYFAPCFLSLVFKQMIDFQSSFKVSQGLSQEILACLYWCFPSPCVVDLNIKNVDSVATSPFFIFFRYVYLCIFILCAFAHWFPNNLLFDMHVLTNTPPLMWSLWPSICACRGSWNYFFWKNIICQEFWIFLFMQMWIWYISSLCSIFSGDMRTLISD